MSSVESPFNLYGRKTTRLIMMGYSPSVMSLGKLFYEWLAYNSDPSFPLIAEQSSLSEPCEIKYGAKFPLEIRGNNGKTYARYPYLY